MADRDLEIAIRLLSDTHGADEVKSAINKVTGATKDATGETIKGTAATEADVRSTEKSHGAKKNLQGILRGLSHEFPVLGQVARLALHPISLVVAGIAGAFTIWKEKVDGLTRSLGGIEMPDVTTDQIGRIEAAAAAWGKFASEIVKTKDASSQVKKDLADIIARIKFLDDLKRAAGKDISPESTILREADVKSAAADILEAGIGRKRAAAGTPGSVEKEAVIEKGFKEAATAAEKEIEDAKKRLAEAFKYQDAGAGRILMPGAAYRLFTQYGISGTDRGRAGDIASPIERENIARQQAIVDRYAAFGKDKAGRAGQREVLEGAKADVEEVVRLRQEVVELRRQVLVTQTKQAADFQPVSMSMVGLATEAAAIARNTMALVDAYRVLKASGDQLKITVGLIDSRASTNTRAPVGP